MNLTFFSKLSSAKPQIISINQYVKMIKKGVDPEYKQRIKTLRELQYEDPDKYTTKKEQLPIVTPHAIINGRREDANVTEHSGIVSVDIDSKNNNIDKLNNFHDPYCLMYHRSVGDGLVVYYRFNVDKQTHRAAFETAAERIRKYGLVPDKHVKALSVPRFISYDPNIYYNPEAKVFKPKPIEDTPEKTDLVGNKQDQEQLKLLVADVLKSKVSILDDRESWVKAAAIFCRAFAGSDEGLELFNSISKMSDKYKSLADCKTVYRSFIGKETDKPATIGSLVYMMEENDIAVRPKIKNLLDEQDDEPEDDNPDSSWKDYLITEEPEDDEPLIQFNGVTVATSGNHTLVIGKKKSRKTLFITMMVGMYEHQPTVHKDIMVADTEQGKKHVWKMRERIKKITGKYVHVLSLRGENPDKRLKILKQAVQQFGPKILIIDGVRDLLFDINDPKECTRVVTWIEKLTVRDNVHVVNVLHLNKTDSNARGHIGSELLNKAETVIELELVKESDLTLVKCEASRDVPFESFAFTHDLHGLPKICDVPQKGNSKFTDEEVAARFASLFGSDTELKYKDLVEGVKVTFALGTVRAKSFIADCVYKKVLETTAPPRSPNCKYILPNKQNGKKK